MAERTPLLVPRGGPMGLDLKPGQQVVAFRVWPVDPSTRRVLQVQSKDKNGIPMKDDKGKPVMEDVPRITLFRMMASISDLDSWQLSAFYQDIMVSMWHTWNNEVRDVEEIRENPDAEAYSMPEVTVTDVVNERKDTILAVPQSVQFIHLPYKVTDSKGAFCFDKDKNKALPLVENNVRWLVQSFKRQSTNPDTCGRKGDGNFPRRLWCPFAEGWNKAEEKEIEEYEANLATMKSWVGKLVYWEREEVDTTRVMR